jgi:hypothetical protein
MTSCRTVVCAIALAALAFALVSNVTAYAVGRASGRRGDDARRGMCALRHSVEKNYRVGTKFLREHPHGTHDFPASIFKSSIRNQHTTLVALEFLRCRPS